MIQLPHHRWQPNSLRELIWVVGIAVALVFVFIVFCGYLFELKWTGLVKNVNFHKRTLWDWLDLLIIPAVFAAGGLWFNQRQQARAEMSETQRAQDEALQAYLDKMSDLLIDKGLHKKKGDYDETRVTARAQTLAVLERLDAKRKKTVLLFLREARLINRYKYCPRGQEQGVTYYPHYVGLGGADLSGAELEGARLISTSGHEPVSLERANLKDAVLRCADLSGADLKPAKLHKGALKPAVLSQTSLSKADLEYAVLIGADLSDADLSGTKEVTNEQLRAATSLEGATMSDGRILRGDKMPNGPTLEDWLQNREGRKVDGEKE
jgi:hypothetical protein